MASPHSFTSRPHRTLLGLSIPVLLSLTAEPITGLIDTAFISSLGVVPLAALGVGTTALSSLFWMFNFLGIGTQTEVAQIYGKGEKERAGKILSLALILAAGFGVLLILLFGPTANWLASLLGAAGEVQANAVVYMQIRLFGAPAVLITLVIFGALRGLQDMRTPLWIALGVNVLNIILDWLFIFGNGPFPAMNVGGSALASSISQWLGSLVGIFLVSRKLNLTLSFIFRDAIKLLQVGGDLFIRTGVLNLFLAYTTRVANGIGPDAGAAHQVIRQVWVFTALALDAYASTVQSLVGFFIGQNSISWVKKVVKVGNTWSIGTGVVLGCLMWWGQDLVIGLLVPAASISVFLPAWMVSSLSQPINSLAFFTDGVHWGTGDYRYLRNAMLITSAIGLGGLWLLEKGGYGTLTWVWVMFGIWISLRAAFGLIRIWPGIGNSVFKKPDEQ
ncbi:MAG: MATE family efflux transporter [Anaerolineales bacterium]|nr:MATE family efflux transporter [Anaerolineales bacterium]